MSTVAVRDVEFEKSGDYRLSPGSAIVGGYEEYRSCDQRPEPSEVVSLCPLLASANDNVLLELEEKGERENNETGNGIRLHDPADDVGDVGDGARPDHPASATMDDETSEEVQHDNIENCKRFEGEAGAGKEEPRGEVKGEEDCEESEIEEFEEDDKEFKDEGEEDYGRSEIGEVDQAGSMDYEKSEGKEVLNGHLQTAPSKNESESNDECGRPTRATRKPSRFRDDEFETRFCRKERRLKAYNRPGRGDQAGDRVDSFCNFHKPRKKQEQGRCNSSGRGDQENVTVIHSRSNERMSSSQRRRAMEYNSSTGSNHCISSRRPRVNRQSLSKLGRPIWHNSIQNLQVE